MIHLKYSSSLVYSALLVLFSGFIYSYNHQDAEGLNTPQIIHLAANESEEESLDSEQEGIDDEEEKNTFIQESLKKALAFSKTQDYQGAMHLYRIILSENANHQVAAINLALIEKKVNGCTQAHSTIEHAINSTRGKRLAKALSLQGSCHIESQQYEQAITSLKKAIEFRPNHAILWRKLARAEDLANKPIQAVITTYQRALSLDTSNLKLRLTLAKKQYKHLDFNASINTLRDDYARVKTSYTGQYLLAWNYLEVRKFNNAKKHIKIARRLDNSKANILKAMQLYADKQYNSSINFIKNLKKKSTSYQYLLALNYSGKKWPKSADKYFNKLENNRSHKYLARLHSILLNKKASQQTLINLSELADSRVLSPYLGYKGALLNSKQGNFKQAKIWLEDLALPSKHLKTQLLYSDVLSATNQNQQALDVLEASYQQHPKNPTVIRKYAQSLFHTQKHLMAEKVMLGLKMSDYKAQDFILSADIQAALKQEEKALLRLAEGIEHWPENTQLRLLMAKRLLANDQAERSKQQINYLLKLDAKHEQAKAFLQENFNAQAI